jgi:outer membrane receptor protein involved in Fe transport
LDITLLGYYQEDTPDSTPVKTLVPSVAALDPFLAGDTNPFTDGYSNDAGVSVDRNLYGVTGLIEFDVNDNFSISSTTGYREFESFDFFDPDGTIVPIFEFVEDDEGSVFFQEFRSTFDVNERLRGFAGASYYFEEATRNRLIDLNQNNALNILLPILAPGAQLPPFAGLPTVQEDVTVTTETESFSVFADLTYDISDNLSFTAGARWTTDDKTSFFTAETTTSDLGGGFVLPGSLLPLAFTNFGELFAFQGGDPTALGRFVDSIPTNPFSPGNPVLLGAITNLSGGALDLTNPLVIQGLLLQGLLTPQQVANLAFIETNVLEGTTAGQTISHNVSFDYFEPRFILQYDFAENWMGYASYSWGIRSGGPELEPRLGTTPDLYGRTVDPEKITSYEVGFKGSRNFEGGGMTLEGALFYYDYEDFQTLIIEQGSLQNVNAGTASATGFELATTFNFDNGLDVFANMGFLDGGFDEGSTAGVIGPAIDLSGNEFRLSPEWTLSGGVSYTRSFSERLEGFASMLASYRGRHWFNPENETANPLVPVDLAQDGYTTVALNAGVTLDERFQLKTSVQNLLDEEFLIDAGNTGRLLGVPTGVRGQPRLWTVGVSARF